MSGVDLGGKTLAPASAACGAAATHNGARVLDAPGENAVAWVFQIGPTLSTGAGAAVTLIHHQIHPKAVPVAATRPVG